MIRGFWNGMSIEGGGDEEGRMKMCVCVKWLSGGICEKDG